MPGVQASVLYSILNWVDADQARLGHENGALLSFAWVEITGEPHFERFSTHGRATGEAPMRSRWPSRGH